MSAAAVLARLRTEGFTVIAADGRLIVKPASRLTDDHRGLIRHHQQELLSYLSEAGREWFEERAAILEFDAGMSRAEAEAMAEELLRAVRQRARGTAA